MSTGKRLKIYPVVTAQALSASFSTPTIDVGLFDRLSVEIEATTSDAAGSFTLQGSLDQSIWVALTTDAMSLAGADKQILIDIQQTGIPFLRVTYTRVSGTGTVTILAGAKE